MPYTRVTTGTALDVATIGLDDATISSVVNQFVFDPADAQHLFLATTMGVFESKNAGERWIKRMEGMKEVLMVVTLGMDPTRSSVLYAGTSGGVYKSTNQGAHWEQVNNGLVPTDMVKTSRALSVTSVQVDPSAWGRSMPRRSPASSKPRMGQASGAGRRVACRSNDRCHGA